MYANEQDLSLRDFDCARLDAFRNSFKDLGITVKVGKGLAEAVHFVSRTRIHQTLKARHVIHHFTEQRYIIEARLQLVLEHVWKSEKQFGFALRRSS